MGRMKSIWEDPEKFIPERFLLDNQHSNPFAFIPFSAGARNCVGQKFAMLEMKSIISKIVRNFEMTATQGYKPILIAELILRSENGVMLNFKKRRNILVSSD